IELSITVDFKEAVFGVEKELNYKRKFSCETCGGTGGEKESCKHCGGRGQISQKRGFMSFVQTCPYCRGAGETIKTKCSSCSGKGYKEEDVKFKFDVPKGVDSGIKIRISEKGNLSKSGRYGDLYILIRVKDDTKFVRDGDDVYIEIPIFITQALLGEMVVIPTLYGTKEIKLKVGTKDKEQYVLEGEGIENIHTKKKGNLIAQVMIKMPKKLDETQEKLIKELQDSFGIKNNEVIDEESFFDKVKAGFNKFKK
ncbi:MAG: molecular chaperone DnaJ, partial [Campylobacter sp.]|nr:molecular chaperone DnaJ [Campylobacter sp.]